MKTLKTIRTGLLLCTAVAFSLFSCQTKAPTQEVEKPSLAKSYEGKFFIGAALNEGQIIGKDTASIEVVKQHFNSIVAENCMKVEELQPEQGVFNFELADKFVEFGEANNMFIIGHTLVWHSQVPNWIFIDEEGNEVSRDTLIQRMKTHIQTVVGHYKGRVNGWDVVNEAVSDREGLRQSKWVKIIGEDFIELAFQFAHEADPEAELYYNDYSLVYPNKRAETVKLVKRLQEKGIHIDAVGMQAHYGLDFPIFEEFEKSIVAFKELGVKVMLTELDVSVLPFPDRRMTADISKRAENEARLDPYKEALPDSVQNFITDHYSNIFEICLKHSESISRVTLWGVNDGQTWRNYWPIPGRTDYPLLFDRNNQPKPVVGELIKLVEQEEI